MLKLHIFVIFGTNFEHKPFRCLNLLPSVLCNSYGCCQDGVTAAQGPNKEGCVEYVAPAPTVSKHIYIYKRMFDVMFFFIFLLMCCVMFVQVASLPTENAVQCRTTTYGCCYDRTTPAGGPNGEGCPNPPNHSKELKQQIVLHIFWLCLSNIYPEKVLSNSIYM